MEFKQEANRIYAGNPVGPDAEITFYARGPKTWVINHTFVAPALRGQGIGRQLVAQAAARARAQGMKLAASCPFARAVLAHDKQYRDLYIAP